MNFENMTIVERLAAIRAKARAAGIISNGDKEWPLYLRLCEKMPPADAMKRALKGEESNA